MLITWLALVALSAGAAWIPMPLGETSVPPTVAVLGSGALVFGPWGLAATTLGSTLGLVLMARGTRRPLNLPLLQLAFVSLFLGFATPRLPARHSFVAALVAVLVLSTLGTAGTSFALVAALMRRPPAVRQRTWRTWRATGLHGVFFNAASLLIVWALATVGGLTGWATGLALLAWMAWTLRPAFTAATQTARAHHAEADARTDPLTALPNRRALDEYAAAIQGAGLPAVVAIADVDFFKRVKDTYGHDAGDAVLFAVAQRLRGACRHHGEPWPDMVGRWGGEEFVLVLPQLPAEAAVDRVEHIRQAVSATPIRHGPAAIPVTCSVGATLCPTPFRLGDAVARADRALLQAKAAGRDQVVWNPPVDRRLTLSFHAADEHGPDGPVPSSFV
jgi:diguanylate cyclase (GGDEF)-like protein